LDTRCGIGTMAPDAQVAAILELHGIRTLSTRDRH
jgi:hypothetical protein